jgi:hypothetical protein
MGVGSIWAMMRRVVGAWPSILSWVHIGLRRTSGMRGREMRTAHPPVMIHLMSILLMTMLISVVRVGGAPVVR